VSHWARDPFIAQQMGVPMIKAILACDPDIVFGSEAAGTAWVKARLAEGLATPELAGRVVFPTDNVDEFAKGVELALRDHVKQEHRRARVRPHPPIKAPTRVVPVSGEKSQGGSIPPGATKAVA